MSGLKNGFKNRTVSEYKPQSAVLRRLDAFLSGNGFSEISPTTIGTLREFLMAGEDEHRVLKCIDKDGSVLVLKNDFHDAVADALAESGDGIFRVYYQTTGYHLHENESGEREEKVLSAELVGSNYAEGEAEIITLALDAARMLGAENPTVHVSHTGVFEGILTASQSRPVTLNEIRAILCGELISGIPDVAQQRIREVAKLIGDISVVETASGVVNNRLSVDSMLYLVEIFQLLAEYGYEKDIQFELGLLPEKNYRKGCFFTVEENGMRLFQGGRNRPFGGKSTISLDFHIRNLSKCFVEARKESRNRNVLLGLADHINALKKGQLIKKSLLESELFVETIYRTSYESLAIAATERGIENYIYIDENGELKN